MSAPCCAVAVLIHCRQTSFTHCTLISTLPFAAVNVALKLKCVGLYLEDPFIIIWVQNQLGRYLMNRNLGKRVDPLMRFH